MKNKIWTQIFVILAVIMVLVCLTPNLAFAAIPPDIIHELTITIDPQSDGSLLIKYDFDYEATTDFTNDIPYVEIGVANQNFDLISYGPTEMFSDVKAIKESNSLVHLGFSRLPKKGERFQFTFTVRQRSMAYKSDEDISFKFRPGWFEYATISELKVIVNLENIKVIEISPDPTSKDDQQAVFITEKMETSAKANTITITANKDSYPQLQTEEIVDEPNYDDSTGMIVLIVFAVIIGLFLIFGLICLIVGGGDGDGYGGGGFIGGFGGGSGRSGGGGGSFSGSGFSCACACACAGGGRVGCSERGLQVLHWIIEKQKKGDTE
ncbi:MAG: hypothetical protein PHX34_00885 [Candidatus Shapirobacteria bacterium]|nr:hypothetical protein [Candidatus Shapirobacteria bacterium]